MNILLTGATGFLGFRTLERLVQLSEVKSIVASGRVLRDSRKIIHPKVNYILGDLADEGFVNSIIKNIEVVINTASLSSPWGSDELFYTSNVLSQKNIINASKIKGVSKIIYISSPSIYYNGEDRLLIKESEPLPKKFVNNYSKTKREAENLLQQSYLNYIIIRPRAIIGRGDTVIMPRLIKAHSEGRLRIIGSGENVVDLTSVENVVESIVLSINAPKKALNETYNITDGKPIKLWEAINVVFKGIGRKQIDKKVKFNFAYFVASILEVVSILFTKKEPSLTKYSVGVLSKTFTLDISKAKKLLNYTPVVTTEQSIEEFINWYKSSYEG